MSQKIFETQQRAKELQEEALRIWRKSDQSDFLEGIEDDPVFSLLMQVMAFQSNVFDSHLEKLKAEVLEEYKKSLLPYGIMQAIPATAVIQTPLASNVPSMKVDTNTEFVLKGSGYRFIPLLETRVINVTVASVARIDGRRWKVTLKSKYPIRDLSDCTFAIKNTMYHDLSVTLNGKPLPLNHPGDYANLPFASCFSVDNMIYNRQQTYNASSVLMELFARHDLRFYHIPKFNLAEYVSQPVEQLELVFQFAGVADEFTFGKSQIQPNIVVLVNAYIKSVTLSASDPLYRIDEQFLHLVRPHEEQLYGSVPVKIRRIAADRFNSGRLLQLLRYFIDHYDSDYNAYQHLPDRNREILMANLKALWQQLWGQVNGGNGIQSGVYLMLDSGRLAEEKDISLQTTYITTDGAAVNKYLNADSVFETASGFDNAHISQITSPIVGCDELAKDDMRESQTRYFMTTQDRIVTPADIRMFCVNQLFIKYAIGKELIQHIHISRQFNEAIQSFGYESLVTIILVDNQFVRRSFYPLIPQVESLFEKMIEVRSAQVYPVRVKIQIAS